MFKMLHNNPFFKFTPKICLNHILKRMSSHKWLSFFPLSLPFSPHNLYIIFGGKKAFMRSKPIALKNFNFQLAPNM